MYKSTLGILKLYAQRKPSFYSQKSIKKITRLYQQKMPRKQINVFKKDEFVFRALVVMFKDST